MSHKGRSGSVGYTYQQKFYRLIVGLMDVNKEISCVEVEKIIEDDETNSQDQPISHNFDDCYIETSGNKYYFQVKNVKNRKKELVSIKDIKINENEVRLCYDSIKYDKRNFNILVLKTDKIETNCTILGFNAMYVDGIYIIPITAQEITKKFNDLYFDKNRNNLITNFVDDKIIDGIFKITKEELPPNLPSFSTELEDETVILRNWIPKLKKGIQMIIGKPGIGKSHYVNEIKNKIEYNILYRFWTRSNDPDLKLRQNFNEFLNEIASQVFESKRKYEYGELINEINEKELTIIIDGLDHFIENNKDNEQDIRKFFNFIEECINSKILILSRPLSITPDYDTYELNNWNFRNTKDYLNKAHEIHENDIIDEIFNKGNGYPIITNYLAKHYNIHKKIPHGNFLEINQYYDKLIPNNATKRILCIFLLNDYYITKEELNIFLKDKLFIETIIDFINEYPYLFGIDLNRISLIHDSLNTYLKLNNDSFEEFKLESMDIIKQSIENGEINYLSRFDGFDFDDEFIKNIIVMYSDFDIFKQLIKTHFDFESIQEFYFQLKRLLYNFQGLLDIYQCYSFILILLILERNVTSSYYAIFYQVFRYMDLNDFNESMIFSKGLFWDYYKYYSIFDSYNEKTIEFLSPSSGFVKQELLMEFNNEKYYWYNLEYQTEELYVTYIQNENNFLRKQNALIKLFVHVKFKEITDSKYYKIIMNYIEYDFEYVKEEMDNIFLEFNIPRGQEKGVLDRVIFELKSIGIINENNIFEESTLKDIISTMSPEGSYSVENYVLRYLRLKNYKKEDFDLVSLNNFYCMYFSHKDTSTLSLPNALLTFESKQLLNESDSIKIIRKNMKQSDDGIEDLLQIYINSKPPEYIHEFKSKRTFPYYLVNIFELKPEIINNFTIEDVKIALRHLFHYSNSIDYYKLKNGFKSKYDSEIQDFMEGSYYKLYNVPISETENINENIIATTMENKQKNPTQLEKEYISLSDLDYIIKNKIPSTEISKLGDGWYYAFSYLKVYDHYAKEDLRKNLFEILHNSMFIKFLTGFYRWDCFLGNLPMFLNKIEYEVEWEILFEIFKCFMEASLIEK